MRRPLIACVILLTAAATFAQGSQLKIYALDSESPLLLLRASADSDLNEVAATIQNKSGAEMKSLTLRGSAYKDGTRVGGFSLTTPLVVYAHGFINLRAGLDADFLSRADVLLLSAESVGSANEPRNTSRLLDMDLSTARLVGGRNLDIESQRKLTPEPNLPIGGCCTSCYTDAQGCGRNMTKLGNCTGACTSFYSCSYTLSADGQTCLSVSCQFNCKNSEQCC